MDLMVHDYIWFIVWKKISINNSYLDLTRDSIRDAFLVETYFREPIIDFLLVNKKHMKIFLLGFPMNKSLL